tara:strand:- start:282 stop:560 length:279 start_codon:yes stop_codon:yes gene_type:complete
MMEIPDQYLKFIDNHDKKKSFIYQYVRGTGDMTIYRAGKVIGKKTSFDAIGMNSSMPLSTLNNMLHRGMKYTSYATLEDLEAELFMDAFLEF